MTDEPPEGRIVQADARSLCEHTGPGTVSLTVTSPPYRNAINYKQHVSDMGRDEKSWMRGTGGATTRAYLDEMEAVFKQVLEATKEGGFCAIVIGDEVVSGKLVPLPSLLLSRIAGAEDADDPARWRLRDVIVWHKVTSGRNGAGNRGGMFIKLPYPGYFRANIMHEYILVLQKGTAAPGGARNEIDRIPLNRIVKREIANSVWNIPPVPPSLIDHPVPFPEQIPWRLIRLLTRRGELVLDPMNGSGQTTKAARSAGRRYLGLDIEAEYVRLARRRLSEPPRLSDYLIPVFYKEAWAGGDQRGFFETERVDLSPCIPKEYRLKFRTESDRAQRGNRGVYMHYESPSGSHMCLLISESGLPLRLSLGSPDDGGSMLASALAALPEGPFTRAQLRKMLGPRLGGGDRHAVKACMDVLVHMGLAADLDGDSGGGAGAGGGSDARRRYEMTDAGKARQKGLAAGRAG